MAEQVHVAMRLETTDVHCSYRAETCSCLASMQMNVCLQMHADVAEDHKEGWTSVILLD